MAGLRPGHLRFLDSCFDAFSSREPVSTSLEDALGRAHSTMQDEYL
jgi:hypothetical protein